jgi:hypothetical protein
MPLYNTATAAVAMGVTPKWLDNLLSHNNIDGLQSDSQGVARRLSIATVTVLVLTKELIDALELPAPIALRIATAIVANPDGELLLSPTVHLTLRADDLRLDVLDRLTRAVEIAPTPRRGRPPKR